MAHAKATVLIVDDEEAVLAMLQGILQAEGYRTLIATNGDEALQRAAINSPDLILMDVEMPGMSGFEATQTLKASANTRLIPIILVTGYDDRTSRLKGLYAGAEEFLSKPVDRVELIARVRNLLRVKLYSDLLADQNRFLEHQVRERTSQLRESQLSIVLTLGRAAEFRDDDSGDHVRRISHFTRILAQRLGMDKEFMESIAAASPLHDVGKIGIPDTILLKPGMLTVDEWQVIQTHTVIGARISWREQLAPDSARPRNCPESSRTLGRQGLPIRSKKRCHPPCGPHHQHLRSVRHLAFAALLSPRPRPS